MKRNRSSAIKDIAKEINAAATKRDANGAFVEPIMSELALAYFLAAVDPLVDMMKTKPIALLDLLSTNKKLNEFFSKFDKVWLIMIDYVVERETSRYFSEVYPFFIVKNQMVTNDDGDIVFQPFFKNLKNNYRPIFGDQYKPVTCSLCSIVVDMAEKNNPWTEPYYVLYHDRKTTDFIEILLDLKKLKQTTNNSIIKSLSEESMMTGYFLGTTWSSSASGLAYSDCFVLDEKRAKQSRMRPSFSSASISKALKLIIATSIESDDGDELPALEKGVRELFYKMRNKAIKLWEKFAFPADAKSSVWHEPYPFEPKLLNEKEVSAKDSYRDMLFDSEKGWYNTAAKQKLLLRNLLKSLQDDAYNWSKKDMYDKYGEQVPLPLQCEVCEKKTFDVDLASELAFCSLECRTEHTSSK